jgi:trehalose-phosphatase
VVCLDYDGTLAEFNSDPAAATPVPGVSRQLSRLIKPRACITVAIVTGRRIADVRRLLGLERGLFISGLHGLEFRNADGTETVNSDASQHSTDLDAVRAWLANNVPSDQGFWIEDKQLTVALHFRLASPDEASRLSLRLDQFVASQTPTLKTARLVKVIEVMPGAASKALAIDLLRRRVPLSFRFAYFGDDSSDEDVFYAFGPEEIGILVGAPRESFASYRVDAPRDVERELRDLADHFGAA